MAENGRATLAAGPDDGANGIYALDAGIRERRRGFLEAMLEERRRVALGPGGHARAGTPTGGYR